MFLFGIKNILKLIFLLPFIVIAIFAANKFSCSTDAFAPEIKGIKDFEIYEINKNEVLLNVTALAKNKNRFEVLLSDIDLNIFQKNDSLGTAKGKDEINIPSDSTGEIKLMLNIPIKKLAQILAGGEDTLTLNFKGKLNAKMSVINMPVDVDIPFKVNLREQFINVLTNETQNEDIVQINKAELVDITLSKSKVRINFTFRNPYGIEFKLLKYPAKIKINGKYAGNGDLESPLIVGINSNEAQGDLLFNLSNFNSATSLLNSLLSRKLEYETEGELYIDMLGYNISFPFSFKGDLLK